MVFPRTIQRIYLPSPSALFTNHSLNQTFQSSERHERTSRVKKRKEEKRKREKTSVVFLQWCYRQHVIHRDTLCNSWTLSHLIDFPTWEKSQRFLPVVNRSENVLPIKRLHSIHHFSMTTRKKSSSTGDMEHQMKKRRLKIGYCCRHRCRRARASIGPGDVNVDTTTRRGNNRRK